MTMVLAMEDGEGFFDAWVLLLPMDFACTCVGGVAALWISHIDVNLDAIHHIPEREIEIGSSNNTMV
jgi:hypothetical protein